MTDALTISPASIPPGRYMTPIVMTKTTTPIDDMLAATEPWLSSCPACHGGLSIPHTHPNSPRPLINDLAEAVQRVRDLCARATADPGDHNGGKWEDPTPIPGWVAAVENALNGRSQS